MTYDDHIECDKEFQEAKDKIEQLQAELEKHRWILVGERLPEANECDEVLFVEGKGCVEAGEFKNGLFWNNDGKAFKNVTQWMPIILPAGTKENPICAVS